MSSAGTECAGTYGDGDIAGAVIGTFVATLVLATIIYFIHERRRRQRLKSKLFNIFPSLSCRKQFFACKNFDQL